jgi:uracil-DNA glycosylase
VASYLHRLVGRSAGGHHIPSRGAEGLRHPAHRIRFRHGEIHALLDGLLLANSYHVSRYNTNTGRLTTEMFCEVVASLLARLHPAATAKQLA